MEATTTTWTVRLRANKRFYTITGATIEEAIIAQVETFTVEWMRGQYTVQQATNRRFEVYATHPATGDTWHSHTFVIHTAN